MWLKIYELDLAFFLSAPGLAWQATSKKTTQPAARRRGEIVTTSLSISQRRRRYVPNEALNDASMER